MAEGWILSLLRWPGKSQSIDVTKSPKEIYARVEKELEGTFEIVERINLEPYEMGHLFLLLRKK